MWTGAKEKVKVLGKPCYFRRKQNKSLCRTTLFLSPKLLINIISIINININNCCGATAGSEQQHNQDLKEIYIGATNSRNHHFLPQCIAFNHTFYHNALHLTRVHCATNKSNNNTGKFASFAAQTQSFLCSKFSTARLEVLPNLRHAGVFQMSTMVNLGIGFQFKSL